MPGSSTQTDEAVAARGEDKQMCVLAKRVPKIKAGLQGEARKVAEDRRQALVGVIQHFNDHPHLCVPTWLDLCAGKITA